eukprot:1575043-Lingulodinium_polyedra.AAC.1
MVALRIVEFEAIQVEGVPIGCGSGDSGPFVRAGQSEPHGCAHDCHPQAGLLHLPGIAVAICP